MNPQKIIVAAESTYNNAMSISLKNEINKNILPQSIS